MVTWGRAWNGAFAWLAWTIIYGIAGVILFAIGFFLMVGSLNNLASFSVDFSNVNLVSGFLFVVIGWIIVALGAIAAFFKINSEIIGEEVNS